MNKDNPMYEYHQKFLEQTKDWPHELHIYFILALYQQLDADMREQVLDAMKDLEGKEILRDMDTEGPMQ